MTITELKQLRSAGQYAVCFSDGSTLRTTANVIADLSLYTGRTLTPEEYTRLQARSALAACRERALRIIGMRAMSEKELYDRLLEKGETPENAAETIAWMLDMHLLDDAQYAGMIVRHYAARGYGIMRIRNELYRRGVPKTLWEDALAEMPETEDAIDRILRSKLHSPDPDYREIKKATDALCRRGYAWEEIKAALERYKTNCEEEL